MRKGNLFPEHIEETETMRNLIDFSGKKIIVAGASSGIGRQTAITLSTVGARLILIARREEKLQETMAAQQESLEGKRREIMMQIARQAVALEEHEKAVHSANNSAQIQDPDSTNY